MKAIALGLLLFLGTQGFAQLLPVASSLGHLSYSLALGASGQDFPKDQYLRELLPVLSPLPLFALDPNQGTALTVGSLAIYSAAEIGALAPIPDQLKRTLFHVNWKFGMYATYAVYQQERSLGTDAMGGLVRRYSFLDLTVAPFQWESYANPVSWSVLPLMAVGEGVSRWLSEGSGRSPLTTGKVFFGSEQYQPVLGSALALTNAALIAIQNSYEEAFWRGYVYEEIKTSFRGNWLAANLLDNALFSLWHIPLQGFNWSIAGVFLSGSLATWAYEVGGLPAAGAAHGMVNALSSLIGFGLSAGVPQPSSPPSATAAPLDIALSPGSLSGGFFTVQVSYL